MKIINYEILNNYKDNSYVTLGFFDGFHLAHQQIIEKLVSDAKNNNYKSVVITFDDSILNLFKMTNSIVLLKDKLTYLENHNVDYVLLLSKDDNFVNLTANEFIKKYLDKLNCKKIYCGSDFSFAKNKEGNKDFILKNTSIEIEEIEDVYDSNNKISSTYIRNLLKEGKIEKANELLANNFNIESVVVDGKKIGRTLGFATANIKITNQCYLLKQGVYFGKAIVNDKEYKAMINVGINPSVSNNDDLKIEAHLLDFNKSIYSKNIKLIFGSYEREEIKFDSLEKLKEQLEKDKEKLHKMKKPQLK